MASGRHALTWIVAGLLVVGGCAPPDELRFRLTQGRDDEPFAIGTEIAISLEDADGQAAPEQVFSIDAPLFDVGPLPYGDGLQLRAEVRADGVVLARGMSLPFDHLAGGPSSVTPDVLVGSLGRVTRTTEEQPDAACLSVAPAADGARLVTTLGTVYAYRVHGSGGDAELAVVGRAPPHRLAGRWVALGRQGFVAVGGGTAGASFVDAETATVVEAPEVLTHHGTAPVLVGFEEGVLVIGGTTTGGASTAVTWLELRDDALAESSRPPLPTGLTSGRGLAVDVVGVGTLALVLTDAGEAWIVDPSGDRAARTFDLRLDPDRLDHVEGAGLAALGPGLVLVAGGRDSAGVSARIDLLVVQEDRVNVLTPRPRALAVERVDAAAIPFGVGRAWIVGGRDGFDLPRDTSELFEVRVDDLPGDAVPTGRVPIAVGRPLGAALDDGSVLVVDRSLLAHYFSPRAP